MTLTIDVKPELEARLQQEANRAGLDVPGFIQTMLSEKLGSHSETSAGQLSIQEAQLMQQINRGLAESEWQQYHTLSVARRDARLSDAGQQELIALTDRLERLNAERMSALIELARLRKTSVQTLAHELGVDLTARYV